MFTLEVVTVLEAYSSQKYLAAFLSSPSWEFLTAVVGFATQLALTGGSSGATVWESRLVGGPIDAAVVVGAQAGPSLLRLPLESGFPWQS